MLLSPTAAAAVKKRNVPPVRFVNVRFTVEAGASLVFDMPTTEIGPNSGVSDQPVQSIIWFHCRLLLGRAQGSGTRPCFRSAYCSTYSRWPRSDVSCCCCGCCCGCGCGCGCCGCCLPVSITRPLALASTAVAVSSFIRLHASLLLLPILLLLLVRCCCCYCRKGL